MGIQENGGNVGLIEIFNEMKNHPEKRDIFFRQVVPHLPKECPLVFELKKVSLILMEEAGKFILEGRLKELQVNPRRLCPECRERDVCQAKGH